MGDDMTDTSREAVERLAKALDASGYVRSPAYEIEAAATLRALLDERDEAAERIEELEAACEVVSSEFEGELWVVCRRILEKTGFDFSFMDVQGITADDFKDHINETLADLKSRAEAAEARVKELEGVLQVVAEGVDPLPDWRTECEFRIAQARAALKKGTDNAG